MTPEEIRRAFEQIVSWLGKKTSIRPELEAIENEFRSILDNPNGPDFILEAFTSSRHKGS